jgi:hypothetical protein
MNGKQTRVEITTSTVIAQTVKKTVTAQCFFGLQIYSMHYMSANEKANRRLNCDVHTNHDNLVKLACATIIG